MERLKTFEPLFSFIRAIAVVFAAIAIIQSAQSYKLGIRELRENHDRSRREFTLSLWDNWAEVFNNRPSIRDTMQRLGRLSEADWNLIVQSTEKDAAEFRTKQDCIALLNIFEKVATAYKYSIGDREVITEGFKDTIFDYYERLEGFRKAWKKARPGKGWDAVDWLVANDWKGAAVKPRNALGQ